MLPRQIPSRMNSVSSHVVGVVLIFSQQLANNVSFNEDESWLLDCLEQDLLDIIGLLQFIVNSEPYKLSILSSSDEDSQMCLDLLHEVRIPVRVSLMLEPDLTKFVGTQYGCLAASQQYELPPEDSTPPVEAITGVWKFACSFVRQGY